MKNTYTEIAPDKATLPKDGEKVIFKFSKKGFDYVLKGKYIDSERVFYIGKKEQEFNGLRTNFFYWFEVNEWKSASAKK